jgi:leucyl aminopeptidase
VVFVERGFKMRELDHVTKQFPLLPALIKRHNFVGTVGELLALPVASLGEHEPRCAYVLVVGLGARADKNISIESYRRALATVVRFMQKNMLVSALVHLPAATVFGVSEEYLAEQTAIIAHMTDYTFDTYKKNEKRAPITLNICMSACKDVKLFAKGLATGACIGAGVTMARAWVNTPANALYPESLADAARVLATQHRLQCRIFDEQEIQAMNMGGLLAVGSGSHRAPRLITLAYKTAKKNAPTLALVGKGITFDSGGLSLKPASGMETMKEDMSGAAAVIATMGVIAQLKPAINVVAVTPLAENLPSGTATKPGDIVRMYNGLTVEIKNTDAEGRLILADALAYASAQYKPAAVIDIATLTGACSRALGPFFTGLFTEHEELHNQLCAAAEKSGELVWRLPLTDDYKKAVDSAVADVRNTAQPQYMAGATTAAVFLQKFVGATPWAHLDIAGTAFDVPDLAYYSKETATGVGVRLFVALIRSWQLTQSRESLRGGKK